MSKRSGITLVVFVLVTVAAVATVLVANYAPLLGLDLQGGVSVVLQPVEDVDDDQLDQAIEIIRQRVDAIGVAEPEITRQGDTILVQIPGVKDQDRALELVGQTAELRFRPVLSGPIPADFDPSDLTTTTTAGEGGTTAPPTTAAPGEGTTIAPTETAPPTTAAGEGESGLGPLAEGESAAGGELAQGTTTAPPADDTGQPVDPTATTIPADPTATTVAPINPELLTGLEPTKPEDDKADQPVTLPDQKDPNLLYQLGPSEVTGRVLKNANAALDQSGAWYIALSFKGGADGIDGFNALAAECFAKGPTCPTGQVAITLDGEVISAPAIQAASYEADQVSINGTFTEGEAKDLALVLRYGALPVELEPQQVQLVSATLGEDALTAGLIAGLVGFALVSLYMLLYYRMLGLVAIASLTLSIGLLWALIAYLGETRGLALTLAGITGIIVSFGIALDSNIVYFEHLREDVHNGRTIRSSVDRSFASAFSTIVKADVASLIGAFLLYWLTVGPVRGFALYLGIATVLDLLASYFFMRPAVVLLGRSKLIERRPGLFGLAAPKAVDEGPVEGGPDADQAEAPEPSPAGAS